MLQEGILIQCIYLGIDQTVYDFYNGKKVLKKKIKFIG